MTQHRLAAVVAAMLLTFPLAAGDTERPHGLMWNQTGLPLVFPLQVKSAAGRDYYMVLSEVDDGTPALAAYIHGGEFFRVLVPPGEFRISFAAGEKWQGEEALFGVDDTLIFVLPEPLRFVILDDSTKGGHIIDLRELAPDGVPRITVASMNICQGVRVRSDARAVPPATPERERDPVGQEILERRFLEGANVFESYDRERQQDDLDPPVLGLPKVPLAKPQTSDGEILEGGKLPVQRVLRVYERPC